MVRLACAAQPLPPDIELPDDSSQGFVLIAHADKGVRMRALRTLVKADYQTRDFSDGAMAMSRAVKVRPDIVVSIGRLFDNKAQLCFDVPRTINIRRKELPAPT